MNEGRLPHSATPVAEATRTETQAPAASGLAELRQRLTFTSDDLAREHERNQFDRELARSGNFNAVHPQYGAVQLVVDMRYNKDSRSARVRIEPTRRTVEQHPELSGLLFTNSSEAKGLQFAIDQALDNTLNHMRAAGYTI